MECGQRRYECGRAKAAVDPVSASLRFPTGNKTHREAGLTGLAQVNGRNALTWPERLELDARYVETYSFLGDVCILIKSPVVVFLGRGVNPQGTEMMEPFRGVGWTPSAELG